MELNLQLFSNSKKIKGAKKYSFEILYRPSTKPICDQQFLGEA
ncbi:hypothetical protein [Cardinium endosymbiont of Dermatophagoides farinae]|nr:hypothetical protein [Cardinium endosymbiont of Dermatophagoides farinae]